MNSVFGRFSHIHFVGIGGIGMSGIAEVLHNMGFKVSGSDISENANVKMLKDMGIKIGDNSDVRDIGETSNRPTYGYYDRLRTYYDTDLKKMLYCYQGVWRDAAGNEAEQTISFAFGTEKKASSIWLIAVIAGGVLVIGGFFFIILAKKRRNN